MPGHMKSEGELLRDLNYALRSAHDNWSQFDYTAKELDYGALSDIQVDLEAAIKYIDGLFHHRNEREDAKRKHGT